MPVRFTVAQHPAEPVHTLRTPLQKPEDCLDSTWGRNSKDTCAELLQSSLEDPASWLATQVFDAHAPVSSTTGGAVPGNGDESAPIANSGQYLSSCPQQPAAWDLPHIRPQANGFVEAVVEAYNKHHHLIIRPDDVWLAILSQFNLYVNANAEALRSYFVAHEGKKELTVRAIGTRYTVNFGALAEQMTKVIDKNVLDKELKHWILPDFTTTTDNDTVASAVMMMSTLKSYFTYKMHLMCGIPSVTLEGDKEDWEKLLARIDRLVVFGREPQAWSAMLRPILTRFVQAFDGKPGTDFWNQVCHYEWMGSGSDELSGWITAFCVWDEYGKWIRSCSVDDILAKSGARFNSDLHDPPAIESRARHRKIEVDGIAYPKIDMDAIPPGFCEVDVKLDDNGEIFECMMAAGHMATRVEGLLEDVIRPHPAWFMFIKGKEKTRGFSFE